ncbi:hypothetical protein DFH29DRAFT_995077 [Suillus ampliporus]|nr:hypothetical protein DFH29DRAFT_995077 [Suillus ampliporus]
MSIWKSYAQTCSAACLNIKKVLWYSKINKLISNFFDGKEPNKSITLKEAVAHSAVICTCR